VRAALAHKAHIVMVSFSGAFAPRQGGEALSELRRHLPVATRIWACGEMTRRLRKSLPGVRLMPDLSEAIEALRTD
jgi:MerR family transcriptional regulator, light-induced transcriptional regulator